MGIYAGRILKGEKWLGGVEPGSLSRNSTWPNPNSAFSRRNVWIAASLTSKSSPRSHRMARPPQQAPRQSRLAIHNRQRRVKLKRLYLSSITGD